MQTPQSLRASLPRQRPEHVPDAEPHRPADNDDNDDGAENGEDDNDDENEIEAPPADEGAASLLDASALVEAAGNELDGSSEVNASTNDADSLTDVAAMVEGSTDEEGPLPDDEAGASVRVPARR